MFESSSGRTAGHTDDIKLGWLVVGLNCQVWNWRVFFKVWNYFYSLTHSKERYKVYKRGRDPWSRHVPNSWEAAVSAAPFLIRAQHLRPLKKNLIWNFFRFLAVIFYLTLFPLGFVAWCTIHSDKKYPCIVNCQPTPMFVD